MPVKALLIAVAQSPAPTVSTLQQLVPEFLVFFLPERRQSLVETDVHPQLRKMPQRWDWIVTPDSHSFAQSHKALANQLPHLLHTWGVSSGELVIDVTSATPAMGAAMALVGFPYTAGIGTLRQEGAPRGASDSAAEGHEGKTPIWAQSNPWDEEAPRIRAEACEVFNQGTYGSAARLFRVLEKHVSGGLKPLYRALADVATGYREWERFHYRQAWDKLKTATNALDLASAWGGPPGMGPLLNTIKDNIRFLERIVLDPQAIKPMVAHDLLAHAKRRAERDHQSEIATKVLLRALEAFAQSQLLTIYRIKSWDIQIDQLPQALQETCRTCYLSDIDGKYRLPLHAQFRALAGLGDAMGQTFLAQWAKMKSLMDAAERAVLGQGFEPLKPERFYQLYEMVVKLSGVNEANLPQFPSMRL